MAFVSYTHLDVYKRQVGDIAHIQARIGSRCQITPMPERALLALQGPQAVTVLSRLAPGVEKLVRCV